MEELTPGEKDAMNELSKEQFDLGKVEKKILDQLTSAGLVNNKQNNMQRLLLQIAASIVLVVGGFWLGITNSEDSTEQIQTNMYALFLYENEEFVATNIDNLIVEYSSWAEQLSNNQKLVQAEKLNDFESYWMGNATAQNQASRLSGYFVFYAADIDEAKSIASTHPHSKYGGGLELRPIDKIE